jgi:hypothetical protein
LLRMRRRGCTCFTRYDQLCVRAEDVQTLKLLCFLLSDRATTATAFISSTLVEVRRA